MQGWYYYSRPYLLPTMYIIYDNVMRARISESTRAFLSQITREFSERINPRFTDTFSLIAATTQINAGLIL